VLCKDDIEVCLKAPPDRDVDVVIAADLAAFTNVWLGYGGLLDAIGRGQISLHGSTRAMTTARRLLALPDKPMLKNFRFSAWPSSEAVATQ
jgi:hypothetical protein